MTLLVVEDHLLLQKKLVQHFEKAGFSVDSAACGSSAGSYLKQKQYDLVILDRGLPDMDGLFLLENARSAAIVMLTAKGEPEDKIDGLNMGADDYVLKPFNIDELEARVRAVLRRKQNISASFLRLGNISFNLRLRQAYCGEIPLVLSRKENMLLECLLLSPSHVLIRDVLEEKLYSMDESVTPNAIEAVVSRLRKKLRQHNADCSIETVRGIGYRLLSAEA